MLNSKKLLYILPDVAYVAELLPTKKEHQFSIQSFRQINGEFLDDNTFIDENVQKLIAKLEPEEYHLILPDFLFTNTIVEVNETTQSKVDAYLKDKLLQDLGISKDSYSIDTFVLTQLKDASKVQLSALEKEVMAPVAQAAADHNLTITGISPLSWTTKSMISLEPSISVIQMGSMLYLAQHYIGIDQTTSWQIDEVDKIAETIKTLKGAEPSIQTLYLLTNELVEEKLKENLSDTVPLQQLTKTSDKENDMPGYVKQVIETGMRTLDIDDFPVPTFALEKVAAAKIPAIADEQDAADEPDLADQDDTDEPEEEMADETAAESATTEAEETEKPEEKSDADLVPVTAALAASTPQLVSADSPKAPSSDEKPMVESVEPPKQIIKNKTNTGTMIKMIFITLAVLFATVAIGVGLGLGILKLSNRGQSNIDQNPVVVTSPTPEATPAPTPTPESEVDPSSQSILVVNATTIAGKAGVIGSDLEDADFGTVNTGNAKGDYDAGSNYVLMKEENQALIDLLEEATDLTLVFSDEISVEDAQGQYDAVIVFADESSSSSTTTAEDEEEVVEESTSSATESDE